MTLRSHVWGIVSRFSVKAPNRYVRLTLPGWNENAPSKGMRVWKDSDGDVLSLSTPADASVVSEESAARMQCWCRNLAEERGAGLIEAHRKGLSVSLIYKRLQMPAYIYTGMSIRDFRGSTLVWTVVAGEHGTTGVREAVVTAALMNAGKLTLDEYRRSWAQDPYDPAYPGVDRSVLRFMSDDAIYDGQFPHHASSKVRRVLSTLPAAMQSDFTTPATS